MAALLALNKVSGMRVYDVEEEEAFDESAIAARRNGPDFILDDQTHIFFRQGGYGDTSPEGLKYLEMLGGVRKDMVPGSLGIKEMTKETWEKEVFWESDTDVTFLNTLAFADIFGGKDFFSTEDCLDAAAMVNEKYPGRVLSLGTLEPNKPNAIERLEYSVKELKMDGLKLYPWDHSSKGGWFADDEKEIYPLWEKCLELGVNKIHMHKGLPVEWAMAQYVHPADVDKPLIDFPDLTFRSVSRGIPLHRRDGFLEQVPGSTPQPVRRHRRHVCLPSRHPCGPRPLHGKAFQSVDSIPYLLGNGRSDQWPASMADRGFPQAHHARRADWRVRLSPNYRRG
jgi:hypothetical protein